MGGKIKSVNFILNVDSVFQFVWNLILYVVERIIINYFDTIKYIIYIYLMI